MLCEREGGHGAAVTMGAVTLSVRQACVFYFSRTFMFIVLQKARHLKKDAVLEMLAVELGIATYCGP